jgi:outer membrane lipoprotein SlyB
MIDAAGPGVPGALTGETGGVAGAAIGGGLGGAVAAETGERAGGPAKKNTVMAVLAPMATRKDCGLTAFRLLEDRGWLLLTGLL